MFSLVPPCELTENGGCDQKCTNNNEEAVCSCTPVDYKLGADGKSCEKIHPCDKPTKGGCEQVCSKDGEKAICSCDPADDYTLETDGSCTKSKKYLFLSIL